MTSPRRGQTADPFRDTQDLEDRIEKLTRRLNPDYVTSLPDNPYNGQVIDYLADPYLNGGVMWRLRYRSTSPWAQKWDSIGSAMLASPVAGSMFTASSTFVALTTGPTLTPPLTGTYEVVLNGFMATQAAGANNLIASIAANGVDTGFSTTLVVTSTFEGGISERTGTGAFTAGVPLSVIVRTANAINTQFVNCQIMVRPIRVG